VTKKIFLENIEEAAFLLRQGEVVAFPTETVYGLGASIFQENAINKIFYIKGRPSDNPLIVHISDLNEVDQIAKDIPPLFYKLSERFFPGPLTIVVPKLDSISSLVSAGLKSIAIRMPSHPIAKQLISLAKSPVVAPSANLSGKPSATCVEHVIEDFSGKIPAVVVGEPSSIGIESTVLSLLSSKPLLLRPGAISQEEIEEYLHQSIEVYKPVDGDAILSPGLKYRHYAPRAKVILCTSKEEIELHKLTYPNISRMILSNAPIEGSHVYPFQANSFYAHLRLADQMNLQEVLLFCDEDLKKNLGLMNRILKSCGI
jgi:L-threonylcarbamoyladenylate synthase